MILLHFNHPIELCGIGIIVLDVEYHQNNMTILEVVMDTDNEIADNLAPGLSKSTVQKNKLRQKNKSNTTNVNKKFNISFDTQIAVLYASYRIVFAIDYSPSMRRIDHVSGKPFYSLLREKVSLF